MDGWTNEMTVQWTNQLTNISMDGHTDKRTKPLTDLRVYNLKIPGLRLSGQRKSHLLVQ